MMEKTENYNEISYDYAKTCLQTGSTYPETVLEGPNSLPDEVENAYIIALREEGYVYCESCGERDMWDREEERFFCPTCD